ncbi:MAG: type II secretion system F family protein [Phycisphaerales bacterium]|nr:type II secretion system F family protein [Phycisphaerales bacterium]
MEIIILGIMVVIAVSMIAYSLMPNKQDADEIVRRRTAGLSKEEDVKTIEGVAKKRAAKKSAFEMAAPLLSKPVMPKNAEEQSTLRAKLASAGFRKEAAPTLFLASKTAVAVVGGLIGAILAIQAGKEMLHVVGQSIFGLGIGFMAPNLWLSMSISKRAEAIRNGLPDSLDLMVVAVESGLGLDAALLRVSDEMKRVYPALSEEFQIATIETQMGVQRTEALTKMAERTAVTEMKAMVATIGQAEKLGTSVAKALRTQAESLRTKRRQKAEERAQKTAVKLLLPLILFIFPTIFIVLAGPAAIQLMETFGQGGALNK